MIARVFPRKTRCTPDDDHAYVGEPTLFAGDYDAIFISVAWTYDLAEAERLKRAWQYHGPVDIGGPATGMMGGYFEPGMFIKHGYTITSRGCPNKCWFCSVWKRDGDIRELPIKDGWNILDDNLLACSENHVRAVFDMLSRQKRKPEFTGGLEAKLLKDWHVDLLANLNPKQMFFAYDTPDDYEPLVIAGRKLSECGFTIKSRKCRCYVLCGYPKDSFDMAEQRMVDTVHAGFMPMAMLWRDDKGNVSQDWKRFQREWARPAIMHCKIKEIGQVSR